MSVQHDVDARRVCHHIMRIRIAVCLLLAQMRIQNHIVGTCPASLIHRLLHHRGDVLNLQVIDGFALIIAERIGLRFHRSRCGCSHKGNLLIAHTLDDVWCIHEVLILHVIKVGTHNGRWHLTEQLEHALHTIVILMVTQRDGIIPHRLHDVHHILTLRDGTHGHTLHVVTIRHQHHMCCVSNRIAQSCQLRIAVNSAMHIILIEHHNAPVLPGLCLQSCTRSQSTN